MMQDPATPPAPVREIDFSSSMTPERVGMPTADPLAEALAGLRMDGMFYCRSELTVPWGVYLPPVTDSLWFHVITAGGCELTDASGAAHTMREGDVVILPHGGGHSAAVPPGTDTPTVFDLPHEYLSPQFAILRHGGGPDAPTNEPLERTDLVCGVVRFHHPAARALLEVLPELIHIEAEHAADWDWFPSLLALMATETRATGAGGEAVVTRLCDILVIQAIRWWVEHDPAADTGWLGALRDPVIGDAVAAIHREPSADWSVRSLADRVSMSRSSFAARFGELVGEGPMSYLTKWRMFVAIDLLRHEGLSVAAVAARTGYRSEASFSRAFKRVVGVPPSEARRTPSQ